MSLSLCVSPFTCCIVFLSVRSFDNYSSEKVKMITHPKKRKIWNSYRNKLSEPGRTLDSFDNSLIITKLMISLIYSLLNKCIDIYCMVRIQIICNSQKKNIWDKQTILGQSLSPFSSLSSSAYSVARASRSTPTVRSSALD